MAEAEMTEAGRKLTDGFEASRTGKLPLTAQGLSEHNHALCRVRRYSVFGRKRRVIGQLPF